MLGKIDEAFRFHESAVKLRGERQQILASNIANADTPNYKARDIDFASALQNVLAQSGGGEKSAQSLNRSTIAHLSGNGVSAGSGEVPLMYRKPVQGSADGNTVDMDVERNQFTDNAIRYEAGLTFLSMKIKGLLTAIQG